MYEKASELGYIPAYECLGYIYSEVFEEQEIWNERKRIKFAINAYKKAAEGGCWWCYKLLSDLYLDDYHNSDLAMKKYFRCADEQIDQITEPEEFEDKIGRTTYYWIANRGVGEVPAEEERIFKRWLPRLLKYAEKSGIYSIQKNTWGYEYALKYIAYMEYLQT